MIDEVKLILQRGYASNEKKCIISSHAKRRERERELNIPTTESNKIIYPSYIVYNTE
jgi:hypothetical protein